MTKRNLTEKEKKICERMISKFEKELVHLRFLIRYNDMMLGEGLYYNYLERIKEVKTSKNDTINDIQEAEFKIRELRIQIERGVEIKELKKPIGVG